MQIFRLREHLVKYCIMLSSIIVLAEYHNRDHMMRSTYSAQTRTSIAFAALHRARIALRGERQYVQIT